MKYFLTELSQLKRIFQRFFVVFVMLWISLMSVGVERQTLGGWPLFTPTLQAPSMATELFLSIKERLIPVGVSLVVLGPVSSFLAPIMIALLVTLLVTLPYAIFLIAQFLWPALWRGERQMVVRMVVPAIILFYSGAALALMVIIPRTFALLYSVAPSLSATPLFALDDFIASVFFLTLSVGLVFVVPVAMVLLTSLGIVRPRFWVERWRGALVVGLLFSAVVTPDGSGVTMVLLAGPLIALYGAGATVSVWQLRGETPTIVHPPSVPQVSSSYE